MMTKHTFSIAAVALVCVLLLAGVVLAQSGGGSDPATLYTVEQGPALSAVEGTASGGGYHLTSLAWRVSGTTSGGGYRLLPALSGAEGRPASPAGGNQCCCTYLPCVLRNY